MNSKEDTETAQISLLWSHSHIWGFLVWHSLRSLNVPFKLVSAESINKNGISTETKLLLVPGGSARLKADALGAEGLEHIRKFVANGGNYLGFCGGCGLALSTEEGLGLCPWERSFLQDRLLHHISGHLYVDVVENVYKPVGYEKKQEQFPVWFPARFAPVTSTNSPAILAKYAKASADLFMADLSQSFIEEYGQESKDVLGQYLDPQLENEPVTISGTYGKGKYLISYAHLETPESPYANAFYANILQDFTQIKLTEKLVPSINLDALETNWHNKELLKCREKFEELLTLGLELQLFFTRTSWLYGWKNGVQGIQFANLRTALSILQNQKPNDEMISKWTENKDTFLTLFDLFYEGTRSWLYARRLSQSLPDTVTPHMLSDQQTRLFGEAMKMNGICGQLVDMLEEIFVLGE